jgi:PAS domain S-box-containing protein
MDAVGDIQKWLTFGLNANQEDRFRKTNFGADVNLARIFIFLTMLPYVAFVVNDYGFFGLSGMFYGLLMLRLAIVTYTILLLKRLRKLTNYHSYDRTEFVWAIFLALANTAINATRPENFVAHTIAMVLAVFVMVIAIPNRFTNQLVLSLIYTFGGILVIVPGLQLSPQASFTILLSMIIANAFAVVSSWLLHFWRRREFLSHEEIQKARVEAEMQLVERKRTEEALRKSERGLAEAQRMAHVGNWEWDTVTDRAYWSKEMYHIFGLKPEEFEITHDLSLSYVHPKDREYVDGAIKRAFQGEPYSIDYRIISSDGKERVVHENGEVIFNEENIPVRMRGTVQDVTENKKTEGKIRALANIVESSNDAIVTMSLDGAITSWNKGAEQIYGYSTNEILRKSISTLAPPHLDKETEKLSEMIELGERIQQYETLRLRKDGKKIYVSLTLSPIFDMHGKLTAISLISRDITKRKEAEETLIKIERTRIKEIHHRIKNNLQIISSLLDLQAEKFSDVEVLEAFKDSQNRISSMALIHEELYKGKGTDTLDFATYIQKLTKELFSSYNLRNDDISLILDLQEAYFDMDTAIPLGIIVNELVSNSLKHAFSDGKEWEISISLKKTKDLGLNRENPETDNIYRENYQYILTVADNGRGIPEEIDLQTVDSLGLQLVNILVEQIEGCIELKREQGTEFAIWFNNIKE